MVAVDLVLGDKARAENVLLNEKINTLNDLVNTQDSLLGVRNRQIAVYQEIRETDKGKIKDQEASINRLKKDIAKQEQLKRTFQVTTGVAILVCILHLIKK